MYKNGFAGAGCPLTVKESQLMFSIRLEDV